MKQTVRAVVLGIVCFALGVAAERAYDARRPAKPDTTRASTSRQNDNRNPDVDSGVRIAADLSGEPLWAYGFDKPAAPGEKAAPQAPPTRGLRPNQDPEEQRRPRHVEGSSAAFSLMDIRDGQHVVDWFPRDHPPMPDVIAHGPARLGDKTRGCGSCHLANGKGRPENAAPAALPIAYILRQLHDFRSGVRYTADPRKSNTNTMIDLAKALTDDEMMSAAEYFASIPWTPWTRVVETSLVPKTRIAGNLFIASEEARSEPIAGRVIEVPENEEEAETKRNPHSGFVAYVPVGSLERGKDLVTTGGTRIVGGQIVAGKTTPCITCHGPDLMGVADIPPIAGRSPSYMVRQLFDIQRGTRHGASSELMKFVVANLHADDMVAIAAYVASRLPPGTAVSAPR